MVIAKFENGHSMSHPYTADYVVVEQESATEFVIRNSEGEYLMSNFHTAEKACQFAQYINAYYTLSGAHQK